MSILAQCPECRLRQSVKNKYCSCGCDLDKAKKNKKCKYWIAYYLPGSKKKKRRVVGYSIEDAKAAEGKVKISKKENRPLFNILPESKMTFSELSKWYLNRETVKELASYSIIEVYLKKFNTLFGDTIISNIKPEDLKNLISKRKKEGCADGTIDQEIGKVKAMVFAAFDNDKVSGDTIKKFSKIKKLDKGNASARSRIISSVEFASIMEAAPLHLKPILMMGYHTGMREGEILKLTWSKVDMKKRIIRLEAADTKDREKRSIPISSELYSTIKDIPKAVHDNHVFLFRGKPIADIRTGLRLACKNAGVVYGRFQKNGFVFHDLRHTFVTNMRKAGVSESVIMKITGHSTRQMFDRYNAVDEADLQQAIKKLQSVF